MRDEFSQMKIYLRLCVMREKEILEQIRENFQGIVVDAYIFETFSSAISSFLGLMNKPYILDPSTYRFQLETITEHMEKRWYENLVSLYGLEHHLSVTDRLEPSSMNDAELKEFAEKVLNYQRSAAPERFLNDLGIMQYLGEGPTELPAPEILLPPYFIADSAKSLGINLNLIRTSLELKNDNEKIYGVAAIDRELLFNPKNVDILADAYSKLDVDGYMLWIPNYQEVNEDSLLIEGVIKLAQNLAKYSNGKPVMNMFGGYLSLVLSSLGVFEGYMQGLGIANHRNPYGESGPAPFRYYMPILHKMISLDNAENLVGMSDVFRCKCPVCHDRESLSEMSVSELLKHIGYCIEQEVQECTDTTLKKIVGKLESDYKATQNVGKRNPGWSDQIGGWNKHLRIWSTTLSRMFLP